MFGCLVEEADRGRRAYDVRFCRSLLLDSLRPLSVSSTPPKNNALDQLKLVLLRPGYLFPLEGHFDQLKLVFAPPGSATKRSSALASLLLQIPESQRSAYALRFDDATLYDRQGKQIVTAYLDQPSDDTVFSQPLYAVPIRHLMTEHRPRSIRCINVLLLQQPG